MGLRGIIIKRETVELGDGQSFEVRGLAAMDVMAIVHTHGKAMALAFGQIKSQSAGGPLTPDVVRDTLTKLGGDFPEVLAAIIALASDAYDEQGIQIASQLPMLTQIHAAQKIFHLSFTSETEIKKLMDSLSGLLVGIAENLTGMKATMPSLDGILGSDAA